jgi:hypothetical protein
VVLLAANLWSIRELHRALSNAPAADSKPAPNVGQAFQPDSANNPQHFLAALRQLLTERGGRREWEADRSRLLARYERLVRTHRDLQVPDDDISGKLTVAVLSTLAERSTERIEEEVRKALSNKGFSDRLIQAACEHVGEQFGKEQP